MARLEKGGQTNSDPDADAGGQQPVNAFPKLLEPPGTRDRESGGKRGELTLDQVLTDFKRYFQSQSVKYKPLPPGTRTPWGSVI